MIYTSCFQTHLVNGVFNFLVNFLVKVKSL